MAPPKLRKLLPQAPQPNRLHTYTGPTEKPDWYTRHKKNSIISTYSPSQPKIIAMTTRIKTLFLLVAALLSTQVMGTDYFPFSYTASDTELDTFESKVLHLNLKTIMCIYLTLN